MDNLIEDIKDSGIDEIKYIFYNLIDVKEIEDYKNREVELTEDVLEELKRVLIEVIKVDSEFAKRVGNIIENDTQPAPAGDLIMGGIVVIALAPLCIILTMHANELRRENPEGSYTDCADILQALSLDKLYENFFS